jgi:hypothetical protein
VWNGDEPGATDMIAFIAFWVLLATGLHGKELSTKDVLAFVTICGVGYLVLSSLAISDGIDVIFLVILDLVLVFKVFGGDIRLR